MAHYTVNQYLQQVDEALQNISGTDLAGLLSCQNAHMASQRLILDNPESTVQRVIDSPWDEVIIEHLRCLAEVNNHNFIGAYKNQAALVQYFVKIFQHQKEENWALPVLYSVALDLRLLAASADTQLTKKVKGKPGETLEKAADILMSCFRVCASDNRSKEDDSKRWGMLNLVNQLFKIYFKINKLHLCKPLIRAIDSSSFKDHFSISQQITYRYYVGRKAMFESDFKNAEEFLTFAFLRCHKKSVQNKRLILIYLIPVKMLLEISNSIEIHIMGAFPVPKLWDLYRQKGHMPSLQLLQKYDLLQFAEVTKAVMQGNLLRLKEAMESSEVFFIKCGIYLILEKLKIITFRNLFKKVHLLLGTHQIPIDAFLAALKMIKVDDIDQDEVHCILSNLIYEGKIKGYISLQHQKLVVSKQNAFPPLSTSS